MIVTLTPNPSVDRTIEVDALHRGAVLRARASRVDPGGKGVNVSRALAANGRKTRAVLPGGGWEGEQLAALLAPADVPVVVVPVSGSVRANVSVVEPDATVTAAADAEWLACTGSLPPGAPIDFYARVVERLGSAQVKVAVDSSGAPLVAALDAGPDLVKPNREELAEATGRAIFTVGDVVAAAEELRGRGVGTVLASLGADGAVLVDASGATFGSATIDRARSAVGAGDAMLAGFLAGGGSGPDALREALAWGAGAASLPGSRMPTPDDLDRDAVTIADRIDPDRPLKERS